MSRVVPVRDCEESVQTISGRNWVKVSGRWTTLRQTSEVFGDFGSLAGPKEFPWQERKFRAGEGPE